MALFQMLPMLTMVLWRGYNADLRAQLEDQRRCGANSPINTCSKKKTEEEDQMKHPDHSYIEEILDTHTWRDHC